MGSKCCKCSKNYSSRRSISTYANHPTKRSRTRQRMVGDDAEIDEFADEEHFSDATWSASGRPTITRRLNDLSVKVGARARFLVEVSSPTPVSVRWEKDGRTVDESDRIQMVAEGNFHCLDISPVCQEDNGLWRVKVTNVVGTAMSSAQLALLVPKAYKKPEFVEPLRAVLTAQGTVSLECKVIGVPTPLLRWFKGANEIKAGDVLALTPSAADPTSLGTYTCLAANCMGTAESTSIVHIDGTPLTIQGFLPTGPKPIFVKELRNEKVKLGGSITLECKVTVPPWPEAVNWYGPKGEVTESSRTHLMEDGAGLYSLKVSSITAEDNGTWKCVATNKHGAKGMSTCLISVNYPKNYRKPKFLESLKAVLTEEGLVSFECKVVGYPTPNLSWFKDGQELKPGDVYQLTGTNSLGSYCCIARNCMGEAQSSAELTLEDIKSQLSEEEKTQLSSEKLPPRFVNGLKSVEAKINETLRLSVKVSVFPEPAVMWFRDDEVIEDGDRYKIEKDKLGEYHVNINKLEFCDQAEWKCVATNDYGQSVTSSFVKLNIPKHYKKPKFLEDLKAVMSDEGAVNLECKVIGVPQPKLKWFKDGKELKPGDIHKIISGQDGTCCLGTYSCLAQNCMGSVSSSASLLGFEEKGEKSANVIPEPNRNGQVLSRDRSLSTIHEERTSQLHDTDKSATIDDRAEEVSFSFDGKEVSVSLYETPDLTEEEALQIVEMYADQISEHVTEQNVVELPPMRFTKESSTSGKLLMEAVVIDVNPEYFSTTSAPRRMLVQEDDLRTDNDVDEFSLVEELNAANLSPDRQLSPVENLTLDKITADFAERAPPKPPRSKVKSPSTEEKSVTKEKKVDDKTPTPKRRSKKKSTDSEKEDDSLQEFEKRKTQSIKETARKRIGLELDDDSLYEFESRKTMMAKDEFKSLKEDEQRHSTETGVARTPEGSQYYSPVKSTLSVASKMTEDEATFDTAEDSAFDKSELSVLETLAHSLHEIQKNLTVVEAHVSDSSTGDMQSAQGISEFIAEPLAEVQKSLEIVEAQIQEFPTGKYSSDVLETLVQPITKFKRNLALLEEKGLPSILESVAKPLENLNREISHIQQATQSQIEYSKSVEQVQESLAKIIERQASVPSDRKMLDSISSELLKLEEKANDDLETYYDRLLNVGSELRSKVNDEPDQEIQDILKAVGDLVKPLKHLTAVTSKSIGAIIEDNQLGHIPSKKILDSLLKPLDALDASLSLLESVGTLKSHRAIRGAGIPILYKVSVPMEELETTIKLVENLSAHSAVEFLIPPLDNLIKVVGEVDVSSGGDGFLEDLQGEGTPIVKNLDDSLDIMLNCIHSIDKGVAVVDSERGIPGKLPALLKPMEDLQKSLKCVEKGIRCSEISYEEVHVIAQELSKPLQSIRSEFAILQHEVEADYSSEPNPPQTALAALVGPLECVQNCISSFHETVMCKSADDPMHLRFVLYALKELTEPLSSLTEKMIRTEEILLGKGDPYQGLKAVVRSVSELRESSSAVTSESNVIEQISNILSKPLCKVQTGLENILSFVDKKDEYDLNEDLLKSMEEPFKELQCALLEIEGNVHENVTEGVTPELRKAVQELQKSILVIQDQSSFEYGNEPSTIEANIDTLQALTQPLQTLRAQFTEVQRSANRTLMKTDQALTSLKDSTRKVSVTIKELTSGSKTSASNILNTLGVAVNELETAVEEANSHLGRGKRVDETRHVLANSLKVASSKLGEVLSKDDDLSVSLEPKKRRSLVLVIHNLKVAIEQSTRVIDCDQGTALDRSRDTLIAIEQLASAVCNFHEQLRSVVEFTSTASSTQGVSAMKEQVDKIQANIEQALSSNVNDKNDKMILESIGNDIKSVQRVLDNLLAEEGADGARVRFVLAKAESIHSDLKDMVKTTEPPVALKTACQAALMVMDLGKSLLNRKSPMEIEIITQTENEAEVSVIGELLETIDELDRTFNRLKREGKTRSTDTEVAETAMEIATLQALVQDCATQASGELLDKAVEVCIPIKSIEVKLSQSTNLSKSDMEETSVSLHNINQVLNAAIRKKEAEKLMQPSTSVIGELLENVGDLETCFDRLKRLPLPNDTTESEINDVGREILALQNIVDDLTSEATGELLDKAQEICIPIKAVESTLKHHAVMTKVSISEAKDKLKIMNEELLKAIAQNEEDKEKREKDFKKLFSSDSLSSSVDVPIICSIVTTIEYMQAHLNSLIVPPELTDMKNFLQKFECSLVRYGEGLSCGKNYEELNESLLELESALNTVDMSRIEVRKLVKAVGGLRLSKGELSKALPALQSILSPLKTLHEELSRPNSPKRLKKAELKYLDSFSKSSTDLEVGLMKLEKAVTVGSKLEVECMAIAVDQLASFIDGIAHEPSLKNLDEESSIHALKGLAQPISAIQTIVAQLQEAVIKHHNNRASELLSAVAKPVRELRTNIALIQDQAMMNCSLSQLDELKQAVALMTQVGTETPTLKQPLLQLQAKLQELESEAELNEVVNELTAPVDALKQAVAVLETKGENSMLLELCHQVVEIINRSDDTLSEMTSIGCHTTRAYASPGDALLKAATLCHELMEDQSLSEMSHTDDTLTPTHAVEHLPSIQAVQGEQRVVLENVDSFDNLSVSVHKAAAGGSIAGQVKAALQVTASDFMEDQTLSELSELDNSATMAAEKLPSIRNSIVREQKMVLEHVESLDKSTLAHTEAVSQRVPEEHMQIATTELNVMDDQTLSDLSPAEMSETLPLEKLTSLRGTVAAEENLLLEEAQSLGRNDADGEFSISVAEAEVKKTSISGQTKAGIAGIYIEDEHVVSNLSIAGDPSAAIGSLKLAQTNQVALTEQVVTIEQTGALSDDSLSLTEASIKNVSVKQSADVKTTELLEAPSELARVDLLLQKEVNSIEELRNIINILQHNTTSINLKKQLDVINSYLLSKSGELEKVIPSLHSPLLNLEKATLEEAESESNDACLKVVKVLKNKENALFEEVGSKFNAASHLLQGEQQDVLKLKTAVAVLCKGPKVRELGQDSIWNAIVALESEINNLSPLATPLDILLATKTPKCMLEQAVSKLDAKESPVLALCHSVLAHIDLGKNIMQKEATSLLKDGIQEITKLKKAVTLIIGIQKEEAATVLDKPLLVLKEVLDQVGPLAKPVDVLTFIVEPVNALKASIQDVEKSGEKPELLEVAKLIVDKTEKSKANVQEEVIKSLKEQHSPSDLTKTLSVVANVSKGQKAELLEPLKVIHRELENLAGAAPEELLRKTFPHVAALKQLVTDLKKSGEKFKLLDICELVVEAMQSMKQSLQTEVSELLTTEHSVSNLQKAVAKLIDIPNEDPREATLTKPLQSLRAALEVMNPKADSVEILRGTVEPVKALKMAVLDLKQSATKSHILNICETLIETTEQGKEALMKEASHLLLSQEVPKLQKAVAILVDIPKAKLHKVDRLNEPLVALQKNLDKLDPGASPSELVKCTFESMKALKQVVADIKPQGETAQLLELCQMVVNQVEKTKIGMHQEAIKSLKADKSIAGLKRAVDLLIDMPKDEGQEVKKLDLPLISLQGKLDSIKPDSAPMEILRGSIEPVKELKQVIADVSKSGEQSELLVMCNMLIERVEEGKEGMQEEATKLLTAEKPEVCKLQEAVAILVDLPKPELRKMSVVQNSLVALKAKLETMSPTAKPEEILRCTLEPVKALRHAVLDVEVRGEKAELLDICKLVASTAQQGKVAIHNEVAAILKNNVDTSTLKKAVAMLVEIPKDENAKLEVIDKPLVALQIKLQHLGPSAEPLEILKTTLAPLQELKQIVTDLRQSGEKSRLVDNCELVIESVEVAKKIVYNQSSELLAGEISDASKLKKAVGLLVNATKDEGKSVKVLEPLTTLHGKLDQLDDSCKPQEILRCLIEPVKALQVAIYNSRNAGEKSELLDSCSLIVEKVKECKDVIQKEAVQLLESSGFDVRKLKKAVSIVVDGLEMTGSQKSMNESVLALQGKLLELSPSAMPEEVLRVAAQPVKSIKAKIADLKANGQMSAMLNICESIIGKVELGTEGLQKEAAELLLGDLKDVSKLKGAVDLLIDIPKDGDEFGSVEGVLVMLKTKLQNLGSKATPDQVAKGTVEQVQALTEVVTKLESNNPQAGLLAICKEVVRHIGSGKEKEKTLKDAKHMIDAGVATIAQLSEISAILNCFSNDGERLKKPVTDLNLRLELLHKGSNVEDFLPDLIEPVKSLKKSISALKKDEENEMTQVTKSLLEHLTLIFQFEKLEMEELKKAEEKKLKEQRRVEEQKLKKEKEDALKKAEEEEFRDQKEKAQQEAEEVKVKKEREASQNKAEEEKLKAEADRAQKEADERLEREKDETASLLKKAGEEKLKEDKEVANKKEDEEKLENEKEEEAALKKVEREKLKKEKEENGALLKKTEEEEKAVQKKAEEEKLKKEKEEKEALIKKAEQEKLKEENEALLKKAEEIKLREEKEAAYKEAYEETLKKEKEEKEAAQNKVEEEKLKQEKEALLKKAEEEKQKNEKESSRKKSEEEKLKKEEEEKKAAHKTVEEEKLKKEKQEKEALLKKSEEEKLKKVKEAAQTKADEEKLKKEKEEKEALIKKAEQEKLKEEKEVAHKKAEEEKLKKEKEENEALLKKSEEEKLKKEKEAAQQKAEEEKLKKKKEEKDALIKKAEQETLKEEKEAAHKKAEAEKLKKEKEENEALLKEAPEIKLKEDQEAAHKKAEEEKLKKEKEEKKAAHKKVEEEKLKKEKQEKEALLNKSEEEKLKKEKEAAPKKVEEEKLKKVKEEKEAAHKKAEEEELKKEKEENEALLKKAEEVKQKKEKEVAQRKVQEEKIKVEHEERQKVVMHQDSQSLKDGKEDTEEAQNKAAENKLTNENEMKHVALIETDEGTQNKNKELKQATLHKEGKIKADKMLTGQEIEKSSTEEKEKAELDKKTREKQQSLMVVEEMLVSGILTIHQLKKAVEIMSVYKKVCKSLDEPLGNLSMTLETLYEKSQVSDFVLDLVQPMMKLKRAVEVSKAEENGLLIISVKLLKHLEPILHLNEIDQKEKKKNEVERLLKQKEEDEAQAKKTKAEEEELEKERIDTELRRVKAEAEKQKVEEKTRKKLQKKEQTDSTAKYQESKNKSDPISSEQKLNEVADEIVHRQDMEATVTEKALDTESKQKELIVQSKTKTAAVKEDELADYVSRKRKSVKGKEDEEWQENELRGARVKERMLQEEKQLRLHHEWEMQEADNQAKREKERSERDKKKEEERKKLEKEKEEVERRERSIKAKLEEVKREKRELEMEEHYKMIQARKIEKERQEQEDILRKANEEARFRLQQEKELELKKQRVKELERRETELDSMKSRERLRKAYLDDLHKKEVAKGISKSLDAVYLSSAEKINRGMEYSASVATMSSARDSGAHSTRGISVVELMDYQPTPVRPERTKKLERDMNREAQLNKWDSRLHESDMRSRPRERKTHGTYSPLAYDSKADMSTYSWDRSKDQNWKYLEYPVPDYERPSEYCSRRSISPMRDFGSTTSLGGTRYQPVPQQNGYQRRRSMSPLERSIIQPYTGSTVSLTSLGSRKHIDELTSARIRPATPTRTYVPTRSRSIPKQDHRAYIVNGLIDKTVIHGGKIRLSCNIGGDPNPSIEWMKDGKSMSYHTEASRYKTECNYGVACLEVDGARLSDAGQYTCVVKNVEHQTATTCTVRVALNDDDDKELESIENELEANMPRDVCLSVKGSMFGMPWVTGMVADPVVPSGGTIAVHVQVAGCHHPEVTWLHGGSPLPRYSPRVHYFEDGGLFTLLLEGATPSESGVYTCRVSGRGRGAIDTTTTVQVVERRGHEKPAIFTAKPDTRMTLTEGDDMTLTCYVGGEPRPQVTLMKGIKDVSTGCRTLKEVFGEYVRLTLKRVTSEDRGTFFVIAKNIYGTDRTFVTLDVRERAKSLTPPSWSERTSSLTSIFKDASNHQASLNRRSTASLHSLYE